MTKQSIVDIELNDIPQDDDDEEEDFKTQDSEALISSSEGLDHISTSSTSREIICEVIIKLYIPTILFNLERELSLVVLPLYAYDAFGASEAVIGLIVAAFGFGRASMNIPSGHLTARFGSRAVMAVGLFFDFSSALFLLFAPNTTYIILLRLWAGFGCSFFNVSRSSFVSHYAPPQIRGKISSGIGGARRLVTITVCSSVSLSLSLYMDIYIVFNLSHEISISFVSSTSHLSCTHVCVCMYMDTCVSTHP